MKLHRKEMDRGSVEVEAIIILPVAILSAEIGRAHV